MNRNVLTLIGAGPGVGQAVARRFAREGFSVGLVARSAENLQRLCTQLNQQGARTSSATADASDPEALRAAIFEIESALGATSVLVYNAAVLEQGNPSALDPEKLAADFRVNVMGALVAAQAVLPGMRQAGEGTIVFTGGGFAFDPVPAFSSLGIGKAGIRNLAQSLHKELVPDDIHVATVTICGIVKPETHFDPDLIAEDFWALYAQPKGNWEVERRYKDRVRVPG